MTRKEHGRKERGGFTLIELLVVIGIIAILVSILLPAAAYLRKAAMKAHTAATISRLQTAIQNYFQDWNAYPGPIPESQIYGNNAMTNQVVSDPNQPLPNSGPLPGAPMDNTVSPPTPASPPIAVITSSENIVLSLSGGLTFSKTGVLQYDMSQIGKGPTSLNKLNPRKYNSYFDAKPQELANDGVGNLTSWTQAAAQMGTGLQPLPSPVFTIPEYLDSFSLPRPIIYLRAVSGAHGIVDNIPAGPAPGYLPGGPPVPSQYYSQEMSPYWVGPGPTTPFLPLIGAPLFANTPPKGYFASAYTFFQNPSQQDSAKNKDSFILISAGYDGIYGTDDDVMYPPL